MYYNYAVKRGFTSEYMNESISVAINKLMV